MTNDDLILCAFRHCLGRKTYIVEKMIEHLIGHWEEIGHSYQEMIKKEVRDALANGKAGMQCDWHSWDYLMHYVNRETE